MTRTKAVLWLWLAASCACVAQTSPVDPGRPEPALLDEPFTLRLANPRPVAEWPHAGKPTTGGMQWVSSGPGQSFDSLLARNLLRTLDSIRTIYNAVGIAAGMFIDGQGTWVGTSGISSVTPPETLRGEMIFGIASNTKVFTATLILKLVDAGILSLEDSVGRWLPPFPNVPGSTKIRNLLNMTSGISDAINDSPRACNNMNTNPSRYWAPEEVLTSFLPYTGGPTPGVWRYSNTNYILSGLIARQATGSSVSAQLRQRILNPLGLHQTYLEVEDTLVGPIAHPWLCSSTNLCCNAGALRDIYAVPRTALYSMFWTSGAIFSRADNLTRWIEQLFTGNVLSPGSMAEMQTLVPLGSQWNNYFDRYAGYGLGAARMSEVGRLLWGHDGSLPGYLSAIYYVPRTRTSIVVLINQRQNFAAPPPPLYGAMRALLSTQLRTLPSPPVQGDMMYAASGTADSGRFYAVDGSNAHTTFVGPHIYDEVVSLGVRPLTRQLHGLARNWTSWDLVRIDPTTGEAFPVSILSLPRSMDLKGMAFRSDTLYVGNIAGVLYRVNVGSGIATEVCSTGLPIAGLAFRSPDELFASVRLPVSGGDGIYRISLPSGDTVRLGSTGLGQVTQDIAFDRTGVLYGVSGSGSQTNMLIRINTTTGAGTVVGSLARLSGILALAAPPASQSTHDVDAFPATFALSQNYPNPFNPVTTIGYQLPRSSHVSLVVYDLLGREVAVLVDGVEDAGYRSVTFDASSLASGVYLYRLRAGEFTQTRKLAVVR